MILLTKQFQPAADLLRKADCAGFGFRVVGMTKNGIRACCASPHLPLHSGNLILKKGFLLYFLPECSSFTKKINIKKFFVITKVPFFSKFSS